MSLLRRLLLVSVLMLTALAGVVVPALAAQPDRIGPGFNPRYGRGWRQPVVWQQPQGRQQPWGWQQPVDWQQQSGWWGHMAYVGVGMAHVRYCPSTNCDVVYDVYYGTRVHVFYQYGGWANIGQNRWIASYLLNY